MQEKGKDSRLLPGDPSMVRRRRLKRVGVVGAVGLCLVVGLLWALDSSAEAARESGILPLPYELEYTPGKATLVPNVLQAGSTGHHLTLTVTLGPEAVQPGGHVDLIFASQVMELDGAPKLFAAQTTSWRPMQDKDPQQVGYLTLTAPQGSRVELQLPSQLKRLWSVYKLLRHKRTDEVHYSPKEFTAKVQRIPAQVMDKPLPGGSTLTYYLGGRVGESVGMNASPRATRVNVSVLVDHKGDGHFKLLKEVPTLEVVGAQATQVRVVAPSVVRPDTPFPVVLQAVDPALERDIGFAGTMTLQVRGSDVHKVASFVTADQGQQRIELPGLPEGTWWLDLTGRSADGTQTLKAAVQAVVSREKGPLLLWGDTHRHSVLADGFALPEEAYRRAIEEEHLDWMCLSEHSHPDPFDAFGTYRRRLTLSPSEWAYLQALADKYDAREDFATLNGYEWTSNDGHRNVYFHPDETPGPVLSHNTQTGEVPLTEFLEAFKDRKVIIIPHHPAWKLWGKPFDWGPTALADKLQRVVEVYSQHGNSEYFNNPRAIHAGSNIRIQQNIVTKLMLKGRVLSPDDQAPEGAPGYVRTALATGLKMGLIASSDNHFYDTGPLSYQGGIAGIYADTLSRKSIWEGLYTRSAIGTSGERILLELDAIGAKGGHLTIGQEGVLQGAPQLKGRVLGTAPLKVVELLRHDSRGYNSILKKGSANEMLEFDLTDADLQGPGFYYLRVEQEDGALGWAGPLWVNEAG